MKKKIIYKLISFVFFLFSSLVYADELSIQKDNTLNIFVPNYKDSSFKTYLNVGVISSHYIFKNEFNNNLNNNFNNKENIDHGFGFLNLGFESFYSAKTPVDFGVLFNYGMGGKDNKVYQTGLVIKTNFLWLKYFEPFYLKFAYTINYFENTTHDNGQLMYIKNTSSGPAFGLGLNFATNSKYIYQFDLLESISKVNSFKVTSNNNGFELKNYMNKKPNIFKLSFGIGKAF